MGQGFSSSNSILVQAERPVYHAGDVCRGVVALNLTKQVETTGIELKVTGLEKTRYEESESHTVHRDGGSHTETRYVTRTGRNEFFKCKVPLGQAGTLPAGSYQFGFAFVLPPNLPSSFSYSRGSSSAAIVYKVKAVCHVPGWFHKALKGKQELTLYQRHEAMPHAAISSAEVEVKSCCCFGRGHCSATLDVDKDQYMPGEQCQLRLQVDNRSSERFRSLEVRLVRHITLRASFGSPEYLKDAVVTQAVPGVDKYTTLQGGMARCIPLALPPNLPPTTRGKLITCEYSLATTLKGGCCVSSVKNKVPVLVYPPQPAPAVFYTQPPPEWQPTKVFAPVGVDVPSAPPLPPDALSPDSDFWQRVNAAAAVGSGYSSQQHGELQEPLLGGAAII